MFEKFATRAATEAERFRFQTLAEAIDQMLPKATGFALIIFPVGGSDGPAGIITNCPEWVDLAEAIRYGADEWDRTGHQAEKMNHGGHQ